MSQNPYQSLPESTKPSGVAPQQKPGGLTAIAVICLVLGGLALLGSLLAIGMSFFQDSLNQFQNAQASGPGAEIQAKMQAVQEGQFIPNLIFSGCNVIIGTLLVLGGIGVLTLKESGRNLLRSVLLVAIVFVIVRGIYGIWNSVSVMGAIQDVGDPVLQTAMQVGLIIGLVFAVIVPMVLVGFYAWSRSYLNKPDIRALFVGAK